MCMLISIVIFMYNLLCTENLLFFPKPKHFKGKNILVHAPPKNAIMAANWIPLMQLLCGGKDGPKVTSDK